MIITASTNTIFKENPETSIATRDPNHRYRAFNRTSRVAERILAVGCIKATINHGLAEEWREVGI